MDEPLLASESPKQKQKPPSSLPAARSLKERLIFGSYPYDHLHSAVAVAIHPNHHDTINAVCGNNRILSQSSSSSDSSASLDIQKNPTAHSAIFFPDDAMDGISEAGPAPSWRCSTAAYVSDIADESIDCTTSATKAPSLIASSSASAQNIKKLNETGSYGEIEPPLIPYVNDVRHKQYCKPLHRARTAPAIFGYNQVSNCKKIDFAVAAPPLFPTPMSVISQAFIGLLVYLSIGMVIYTLRGHEFSGVTTNSFFDALYFCIVSMCTIGYGDITPVTPVAKLFSCVFVLVGFGFIDILLSAMVTSVLQRQETILLNSVAAGPHETAKNYLVDIKKGRMRVRSKVVLAFGVVVLCIGVGTLMMRTLEGLGWLDSFYLSCMSVTTVGYGDHAFRTLPGRVFASIWLLVSTLAVAQSFLYLAEARIDKRHRLIAKWILQKEMTYADMLAADMDNDGSVSKSDFVLYKLKEMRKIEDKDIMEVCKQFNRLDPNSTGKITLSCLVNLHKSEGSSTPTVVHGSEAITIKEHF